MVLTNPSPVPAEATATAMETVPTITGDANGAEGGVLIVGNHCHDVLFRNGIAIGEGLGGAAAFVSNVLDPLLPLPPLYVSKVGADFGCTSSLRHPPIISAAAPTTLFHAHFAARGAGPDRILRRVRSCEPIYPSDLPDSRFGFGLAVGVAGEITPETLERMIDICGTVFVDAQAMIRTFDPADGAVGLVPLRETGFARLLDRIGFLKASAEEAPFLDLEEVRKCCCVIVTEGEDGCRLYWKDGDSRVSPFRTVQVDPTGAGDSFFGAFVAGQVMGLGVLESALLGNFFGSLTVSQIGVPKFEFGMLEKIKGELEKNVVLCAGLQGGHGAESRSFWKSDWHEKFRALLVEAAKLQSIATTMSNGECRHE